jgi:hypothetical protein
MTRDNDLVQTVVTNSVNPRKTALKIAQIMFLEIGSDWSLYEEVKDKVELLILHCIESVQAKTMLDAQYFIEDFQIEDNGSFSWQCLVSMLSIFERLYTNIDGSAALDYASREFLLLQFTRLSNDWGFTFVLDAEREIYQSNEWRVIEDILSSL